ncbi:PaaX family transcriptional regulator C-terminal domain-containing protein [Nonomuraea sp. NPDC046570]|uniref:PaaX family transcriptional regulator C-terminal domain-containing protein n=1 Tax=Nonomuraea sp. NPDC046570 TaxID=3155255 RepID=UPI0033EFFEA4
MSASGLSIPTRTLVLAMVDQDGRLDGTALYEMARRCDLTDQQVRQCLRRLVADGSLRLDGGRGRRAVFVAAPGVASMLLPELRYLQLAYGQGAGLLPWDGTWHLVAFSVPEFRRVARDTFRGHLRFLGGAPAPGGLYVCANDWHDDVLAEANRLEIAAGLSVTTSRDLRIGGVSEPRALAGRLWDLSRLEAEWIAFERRLASSTQSAPDALLRVVEFAQIMERDPLLPLELLPPDWPGARARAAMAAAMAAADSSDIPLTRAMHVLLAHAR